jgi:hypothetical protein
MADNNPITPGAPVPPKPPEASKVQPKKETVRISLPPKPTSSPTIKLPTLPAGGPATSAPTAPGVTAAPVGVRPPTAAPAAPAAPAASAAPASRPPTGTGAAVSRPPGAPAGSVPAPRPPVHSAAKKVSGLDVGLSIAAAVVGLGAVVSLVLLLSLK